MSAIRMNPKKKRRKVKKNCGPMVGNPINPRMHFPKTARGRPRTKRGRPAKLTHTGRPVFFSDYEKKKTRRVSKRGRPAKNDYWIADCYVKGILINTYIGSGTKSNAMKEANDLLNTETVTHGKIMGSVGTVDKVELSGPYPREDGKPDHTWPRL